MARLCVPSGPTYSMTFVSGLLYPSLPSFERDPCVPLSHPDNPESSPTKSSIPAAVTFMTQTTVTRSRSQDVELSFHHEGVGEEFGPDLGRGELRVELAVS